MGRPQRTDVGGYVYHVLNRANARVVIFNTDQEYQNFENAPHFILSDAQSFSSGSISRTCG